METVIERAAKALCEAQGYVPFENEMARASDEVRAVLLAVREPSEAMGGAGKIAGEFDTEVFRCGGGDEYQGCDAYAEFDGAESVWQAMIDAALAE